jgi:thiosulfate/3-mercaptopyruvate sulfurtransferase
MRRWIAGLTLATLTMGAATEIVLVQPKDLAAQLQGSKAKPALFYVGYKSMFRKHIPAAVFAGPGSGAGLALLKAAAADLPRGGDMVIYCGCCPYNECPNVKPAFELLKEMGFTKVRVLMIPTNFASDWIDQGYPIEQIKPAAKQ